MPLVEQENQYEQPIEMQGDFDSVIDGESTIDLPVDTFVEVPKKRKRKAQPGPKQRIKNILINGNQADKERLAELIKESEEWKKNLPTLILSILDNFKIELAAGSAGTAIAVLGFYLMNTVMQLEHFNLMVAKYTSMHFPSTLSFTENIEEFIGFLLMIIGVAVMAISASGIVMELLDRPVLGEQIGNYTYRKRKVQKNIHGYGNTLLLLGGKKNCQLVRLQEPH